MTKKIHLTEAQFRKYTERMMKEAVDNSRSLEPEEVDALLHKMVDNDFVLLFPKVGRRYVCAYPHEKAEIFYAVCAGHPKVTKDNVIELENKEYGIFYMENLINAQL